MKTTNAIKGTEVIEARDETSIIAMRFMCIPGIKPVIVPARRPARIAKIISSIIVDVVYNTISFIRLRVFIYL